MYDLIVGWEAESGSTPHAVFIATTVEYIKHYPVDAATLRTLESKYPHESTLTDAIKGKESSEVSLRKLAAVLGWLRL